MKTSRLLCALVVAALPAADLEASDTLPDDLLNEARAATGAAR